MIDSTRLSTSLATALRDRSTTIPIQPNRSLPLRPAPPIPTRNVIAKTSNDSSSAKLNNVLPAISTVDIEQVVFENDSRSPFRHSGKRPFPDHENKNDIVAQNEAEETKNASNERFDAEKTVPPLKLKKVFQNQINVQHQILPMPENGVERDTTNYKVVTDTTAVKASLVWSTSASIPQSNRSLFTQAGNDVTSGQVDSKAEAGTASNFYIAIDDSEERTSARTVSSKTSFMHAKNEEDMNILSAVSAKNGKPPKTQNPQDIEKSRSPVISKQTNKIIPECPNVVPISMAKIKKSFSTKCRGEASRKRKPLETSKKNDQGSNLPSMPSLECFDEGIGPHNGMLTNDAAVNGDSLLERNWEIKETRSNENDRQRKYNMIRQNENLRCYTKRASINKDETTSLNGKMEKRISDHLAKEKANEDVPSVTIRIPECTLEPMHRETSTSGVSRVLPKTSRMQKALKEHNRLQQVGGRSAEKTCEEKSRKLEEERPRETLRKEEISSGAGDVVKTQPKTSRNCYMRVIELGDKEGREELEKEKRYQQSVMTNSNPNSDFHRESSNSTELERAYGSVRLENLPQDLKNSTVGLINSTETVETAENHSSKLERSSSLEKSLQKAARIDGNKLKYRRRKLKQKLQELQMEKSVLQQQLSVNTHLKKRTRLQQMINFNEKQVENIKKHLNKLSADEKVNCTVGAVNDENNSGSQTSSPDPPKLSPNYYSSEAKVMITGARETPPVLLRFGLPIPENLETNSYQKSRTRTTIVSPSVIAAQVPDNERVVPEVVNLTDDDLSVSRFVPKLNPQGTLNALRTPIEERQSSPREATVAGYSNAAETNCSDDKCTLVKDKSYHHGGVVGNDSPYASNASNLPSLSSESAALERSGVPMNIQYLNYPAGNAASATNTAHFERDLRSVDYTESGRGVAVLKDSDKVGGRDLVSSQQPYNQPPVVLPEGCYRPLNTRDCMLQPETSLNHRVNPSLIEMQPRMTVQRAMQFSGMESAMLYSVDQTGPLASMMSICDRHLQNPSSGKPVNDLQNNRSYPKNGEEFARSNAQAKATRQANHRIMTENFPTFGNWAAQMQTSKEIKRESTNVVRPTVDHTLNFQAPASDMYKMTATVPDAPRGNVTANVVGPRWKAEKLWLEQPQIAPGYRQGLCATNAASFYQNNFAMNPYICTGYEYPPGYPYSSLQYPQAHSESSNIHRVSPMNSHAVQYPSKHSALQNASHYTMGMAKPPAIPGTFQSQILNPEFIQAPPSSTFQSCESNTLQSSYYNSQFRPPDISMYEKQHEETYRVAGNQLPQINPDIPPTCLDRNYLSTSLESRDQQKDQACEQSSSSTSMTFIRSAHMVLANDLNDVDRNCKTPHLGRVEYNPNTVSNICTYCGSTGSVFKCLGCELAYYCNEHCQAQHWYAHVKSCRKRMPKLKKVA